MNKEFFQQAWGEQGYYEYFSYGVGIKKVCSVALFPFLGKNKTVLELGSGGGVFTEIIIDNCFSLVAVDVINRPYKFKDYRNFNYIELSDNMYRCAGVGDNTIDFCFSYNLFCHFSNTQMKDYITDVHRCLKSGGDFVFMLANYEHTKKNLDREYQLGELTTVGHYCQDERTLGIVADRYQWITVNSNMIPEHRDIIVHLKKK